MAVSFHRFTQKPQRSVAVPLLRNIRLQNLALVVNCSPEIVGFAVDPDENLIQMPAPMRPIPVSRNALLPDLRCEHRSEPIPPNPDGFVADVDPAFVEQILHLPSPPSG
jgi:hypothetical protein